MIQIYHALPCHIIDKTKMTDFFKTHCISNKKADKICLLFTESFCFNLLYCFETENKSDALFKKATSHFPAHRPSRKHTS